MTTQDWGIFNIWIAWQWLHDYQNFDTFVKSYGTLHSQG